MWRTPELVRQRVTYPDGSSRDSVVLPHGFGPTHYQRGSGLAVRGLVCRDSIRQALGQEPGWYAGWSAPEVIWPTDARRHSRSGRDAHGRRALVRTLRTRGSVCSSSAAPVPGSTCEHTPRSQSLPTVTVKTWYVLPGRHLPLEIRRDERTGRVARARSSFLLTANRIVPADDAILSTSGYEPAPGR